MNLGRILSLITAVLAESRNDNLKFFSIWSTGAGSVKAPDKNIQPDTVNFFFDVNDTSTLAQLSSRGFGPSLLDVRTVLFWPRHDAEKGLRPDYAERWNATLDKLRPFIANGSAMGVFLGDELCWNCVHHAELTKAADLVRATIPPLPSALAAKLGLTRSVLYYNEAFPPLDDVAMWNKTCGPSVALESEGGGYPNVPPSIDWVSMDYYPNEGTFAGAQRIYYEKIFPKMQEHQRVLFVPPAFSCSNGSSAAFASHFCCNNNTRDGANPPCNGNCEEAQARWARAAYDWARNETRFVGLNPWYWEQPGAPPPSSWPRNTSDVPGLRWLTQVLRPLYEKIGQEIVSGRQGKV
jgi:hypothetical protein